MKSQRMEILLFCMVPPRLLCRIYSKFVIRPFAFNRSYLLDDDGFHPRDSYNQPPVGFTNSEETAGWMTTKARAQHDWCRPRYRPIRWQAWVRLAPTEPLLQVPSGTLQILEGASLCTETSRQGNGNPGCIFCWYLPHSVNPLHSPHIMVWGWLKSFAFCRCIQYILIHQIDNDEAKGTSSA